ncbi:tRNA (adenosine(37)-N6)-dimethylallyltransferase MiaA [Cellulosilyticum sp. I15G10I2]|uniref:tRNA (adenosine(37)-N6)-dimethylallyltransferase MiaA n=1 Tax=Cellulosilyticum sp. I15G10I2 TaxID=1892843 RepID=UPI00085BE15B|nr:tRNA (adenosine(37)-N6)-dimethylallyltransferase MiaA [Cellulosilyticum sp. I15G10I2]
MKKPLILIAGPTASGKTGTSVLLAQHINGEIISADSMQIYTGMDIGTAKVKDEEMQDIPHYMIDELSPNESCSVAWFKERVNYYINLIYSKGKIPILVGGTGFYINAILYDTHFDETKADSAYRSELLELAAKKGADFLHDRLYTVDPVSAAAIHPNNVKRVIRALEYYHQTHMPISFHNEAEKVKRTENVSPYDYTFFALTMERDLLYHRINERVEKMVEEGLIREVQTFFDKGYSEDLTSMKAIGYKEFFPYFKGEASLDTCISKLKQNTRHYAKRQLTWFKHQADPIFIEVDKYQFRSDLIVHKMCTYLEKYC